MQQPSGRVLTVTQLNEYVGGMLSHDPLLRNVRLSGEVSNFRVTASGHAYFALKDEQSLIRCAMFRDSLADVEELPEDGTTVVVFGYVSLYARDGQYQFYVRSLELTGAGELYLRFERTKKRLAELGWFDPARKKRLPLVPGTVGVVTSATGAVIHDIQNVAQRRFPGCDILLAPSAVQGNEAPEEIAEAITALNALDEVTVIIVARGGGSMEDLWAFNDERVAAAIFGCTKPVVSAVGHETDFTIADFVADLRAPTPSAAAELVWPRLDELTGGLDFAVSRMQKAVSSAIIQKKGELTEAYAALLPNDPIRSVERDLQTLDNLASRILKAEKAQENLRCAELAKAAARLDAVSPLSTLKRGYAYVEGEEGVVTSALRLCAGDRVSLVFSDGRAKAEITGADSKQEDTYGPGL